MFNVNGFPFLQCGSGAANQFVIQRLLQAVILRLRAIKFGVFKNHLGWLKNPAEIETAGFPVIDRGIGIQQVNAADHFVDGPQAQLCHD